MTIDLAAAERFIHSDARVLERYRLAVLRHGAPPDGALRALCAYRNPDGGFGHALEPDVRSPDSEPIATLAAFEVLVELGARRDPMAAAAAAWIGSVAAPDGGVPNVMPTSEAYPHAPWMVPSAGGSQLTLALAAVMWEAGVADSWLDRAAAWGWDRVENGEMTGYWVKFGLRFLDHVPDAARARRALERFRAALAADGSIPVPGGIEDERITPLGLSPRPGLRSRALFGAEQIGSGLDALERGQQDDGGWMFDWLAWSPGQTVEWRGLLTLQALATLQAHGRI